MKTFESDLILTENTSFLEDIIVKGDIICKCGSWNINARNINASDINAWNINASDINARNINASDINAWDIICEKRIKKTETAKTKCRIYIQNKSKINIINHEETDF